MAKQNKAKSVKKAKKNKQQRVPRAPMNTHATDVARILLDPCHADMPRSYYPGESGYMSRFSNDISIVGAGNTASYFGFHPNSGWTIGASVAAANTAINPNDFVINTNTPGFNFLAANASKVRAVAACINVIPSALSITNITGDISVGIISPDALRQHTAVIHTIDQLGLYTSARTAIERRGYEVKWKPGFFDDKYLSFINPNGVITGGNGSDLSDTTALLVCVRGLFLGAVISLRITWVVEWVPKFNLGLPPTAAVNPTRVNAVAVSAALDHKRSDWWHNLMNNTGRVLGNAATEVGGAFARGAMGKVESYLASTARNMLNPSTLTAGAEMLMLTL